jgi:F-type H+-transporting ATPase subunit delta
MRAIHYAKALYDLTQTEKSGGEKLLTHFVGTVAQNGHAHLLPKILKSYERLVKKDSRTSVIEVASAHVLTEEEVTQLLKKEPFKNLLTASHKSVVRKTDKTLVGGAVVRTGTMRVDASYKRLLLDLYQSLITRV